MEEKKRVFIPKDASEREKQIFRLHIYGLVLVVCLIGALAASVSYLVKSIMRPSLEAFFNSVDVNTIVEGLGYSDFGYFVSAVLTGSKIYRVVTDILTYAGIFGFLGGSIAMLFIIKNKARAIAEMDEPMKNPVKVSKAKYVWLGFLLGAYGGHMFAIKDEKAWIYLILGVVGTGFMPAIVYTTGISFTDAFLACYSWKDHNGQIEVEKYPYWI